jgi:transposase
MKRYVVTLTAGERHYLEQLLAKGKAAARTLAHARVLLHADQAVGGTDAEIADTFGLGVRTVERVRQRFVEEGLEAALKPRSSHLVALACSDPPPGRRRWTLRLLAGKLVELDLVESISHERVRQALKKTS